MPREGGTKEGGVRGGEMGTPQFLPKRKTPASAQKGFGPARVKGVGSVRSVSPQLGAVTLHPAGTCSDALISQTEFMGDYHTAPAKLCCSAGNRYAPVLNPKRPCYICQACPGKAPSVQMLSLLCLHQKI